MSNVINNVKVLESALGVKVAENLELKEDLRRKEIQIARLESKNDGCYKYIKKIEKQMELRVKCPKCSEFVTYIECFCVTPSSMLEIDDDD